MLVTMICYNNHSLTLVILSTVPGSPGTPAFTTAIIILQELFCCLKVLGSLSVYLYSFDLTMEMISFNINKIGPVSLLLYKKNPTLHPYHGKAKQGFSPIVCRSHSSGKELSAVCFHVIWPGNTRRQLVRLFVAL